jgi:hypothetical protein
MHSPPAKPGRCCALKLEFSRRELALNRETFAQSTPNQITRVGIDVCVSTFVVTLPSTTAPIPLRPCEAITMRSQSLSLAVATIAA